MFLRSTNHARSLFRARSRKKANPAVGNPSKRVIAVATRRLATGAASLPRGGLNGVHFMRIRGHDAAGDGNAAEGERCYQKCRNHAKMQYKNPADERAQ